ncbi:lysophospholipid acyltransferase family protein [Helicobacter sp.]|uniref:lysophospholipid acyltransferase family protein n=1 Tax=Helicobacter sp. TaxID=218 RepID=UPI0025C1090E|nr:lysophospholipid acyltransferase family protein [Helicobacter sp.]MCI5969512.1 1-acyl-sn-glycerol-3-phosphate acyltransferase [Helicobacter sp.]MDY2584780.1 lysophospholipid acyltransferase family protein [Helicobacter sp.]
MMSKIRAYSALVYILLVIPFGIVLMYGFNAFHRKIRQSIALVFLKLFRVKAHIQGALDPSAQILIMNHQSFMDVMYFEAIHPNNLCWIAKKELGEAFLYGHALKAPRMILINRESKKELVFLLKEAKDRLDSGRMLCIFPEGTRSKGGEKLLPFKSGAKVLVEHFKLKVQPVVFCGTRKCFNFEKLEFDNAPFSVQYLESFTPENPKWFEELEKQMQEVYCIMHQRQNQCTAE